MHSIGYSLRVPPYQAITHLPTIPDEDPTICCPSAVTAPTNTSSTQISPLRPEHPSIRSTAALPENSEQKFKITRLVERTRNLYAQVTALYHGGSYNKTLNKAILGITQEIQESIPVVDGRVTLFDESATSYKAEKVAMEVLLAEINHLSIRSDNMRLFSQFLWSPPIAYIEIARTIRSIKNYLAI